MKCRKCGAEIDDDSLFCELCGARQAGGADSGQRKKILTVSAAAVVLAAVVLLAVLLPGQCTKETHGSDVIDTAADTTGSYSAEEYEALQHQLAERDSTIQALQKKVDRLNQQVLSLNKKIEVYQIEVKNK